MFNSLVDEMSTQHAPYLIIPGEEGRLVMGEGGLLSLSGVDLLLVVGEGEDEYFLLLRVESNLRGRAAI